MLHLFPQETILLVMRRHWVVFLGPTIIFIILLIAPPLAIVVGPRFFPALGEPEVALIVNFFLALYVLGLLAYLLVLWIAYYLDVWIITDQRLIDIEQHGLFHREISEIAMDRVQDVTIEIPGFIPTLLQFGNIKIRTASQGEFTISDVPDYYRAKDLILKYSRLLRQDVPHQPQSSIMAG